MIHRQVAASITLTLVALLGSRIAIAQEKVEANDQKQNPRAHQVLDEKTAGGPVDLMLHRWLMQQLQQADTQINASAEEIDNPEKLQAWQQRVRRQFRESLGEFPERTPLNPVVTGTVQADGYRVEKILFESRPLHYVTAALFLPDPARYPPPYPAILIPCGHSQQGKGISTYQRGAVIAAANGMAAMIYDPIDQGERIQEVNKQGEYKFSGTSGHNKVGVSAILLGWNTATFRVWDGMRALDYLQSRQDIDPEKLGCMGNSGGGTLTALLTALDERIVASAPSCYITSLTQVCASIGPQDAEQNIFGQMAFGMDHAEYLLLRTPAPILICSATQDFFPIDGARKAFARTRSVYRRLGFEDRIAMIENEGTHGWAEPLRVGANRWMNRWLRENDDLIVPPIDDMGIPEDQILVTSTGQVMLLPEARSVYDLMRDELARLEALRPLSSVDLRTKVRRRSGIRPIQQRPDPLITQHGDTLEAWGSIQRVAIRTETDLLLPCLMFVPSTPVGRPILMAHGQGKTAVLDEARKRAEQGRVVLAIDLTGFGELHGAEKQFYGSPTKDEPAAVVAYLLGKSLTGMRAEDLLLAARWLGASHGQGSVDLHAASWAVTPALHAAVAEPELFAEIRLTDRPPTWRKVVLDGARHRYSDVVHGALQDYDLTDLEAACQIHKQ